MRRYITLVVDEVDDEQYCRLAVMLSSMLHMMKMDAEVTTDATVGSEQLNEMDTEQDWGHEEVVAVAPEEQQLASSTAGA